jgi:signal transduction histidine kinase
MTVNIDPLLKDITADRMKFKQILYNLLSNAIKFTPRNGKVFIRNISHDGQLKVSITDTGIGIPEDRIKDLFQPFNQLHQFNTKKYEGTGLGLALTQKFIHMHGGQIEVESTPGEGTTFSFSLPMCHDADI